MQPWSLPIPFTLVLIASASVYLRAWYRRGNTATWRPVVFVSGIVLLWVAVASPLGGLDHRLLTAHMAQHLLLMNAAAPLILLGATGFWAPHSRSPVAEKLGRVVTHPVFCWLTSTGVVIGWHIPAVFEVGMRSAGWHEAEQASFFAAGLLFWWPVVQPLVQPWPGIERWSRWRIPLYLFLATLPCDALSAFLTFCNRVVYPHYQAAGGPFGLSPLSDQECAGALMWVCVTFAYLAPAAGIVIQLLWPQTGNASQVEPV